jgi:hypothetical protein
MFAEYDELPLLLDHTGWFSVTPQPVARHIAERCRCDVIVDAFCGIGGNAIEFAKTCERGESTCSPVYPSPRYPLSCVTSMLLDIP